MAGFARLREGSVMRIAVAVRALREWNAGEARNAARRRGRVTLGARHLRVKAGEREPRLVMVDLVRRFPVREIVALQARLAQLSFVGVRVACHALLRKTQEGVVQVFHFDQRAHGGADSRRRVALAAFDLRVLAFERVARLLVVEFLQRRDPVNQREILAVVLGMAFRALFAIWEPGV